MPRSKNKRKHISTRQPSKPLVPVIKLPLSEEQDVKVHPLSWLWRKLRTLPKLVWASVGGMVTIISLLAFSPDITVERYDTQDPKNPFAQLFSIQNTSQVFPIYKVQPTCSVENVQMDNGNFVVGSVFSNENEYADELAPQAKITATCRILPVSRPYTKLSIAIQTRYRFFVILPECKATRFEGVATEDSSYIWTPKGTYACPK